MFKKSFSGLVIVMVVALIGITSIQFIWIKNTWNESEKLLNTRVEQCLNDVEHQLNNLRHIQIMTKQYLVGDSLKFGYSSGFHDFKHNDTTAMRIEITSDSKNYTFEENDVSGKIILKDTNQVNTKRSIYTDDDSALKNVDAFISQIIEEMDFLDSDKDARTDSSQIAKILDANLTNNNLNETYTWGLLDHENGDLKFHEESRDFNFNKPLFGNDILMPNRYSLMVSYPVTSLIWKKTGWMIFLSIVFTFIIIFVFILALNQVQRHKKISEIKSDFLNNLTHEFKTPLASISLAGDTIMHPNVINDNAKVKEYVGIIKSEKERLNSHVERILELAALDKNKLSLNLERMDLVEITKSCIQSFELLCNQRSLAINFDSDSSYAILADDRFLPSIISNVLDNAIKYSPDNSSIDISFTERNNKIGLIIKDNGRGMNKNELKLIFDNFYRVDSGNIHNTKGFGIGLSFVKKMMKLHEGEISIVSERDKGTEVGLFFRPYE